MRAISSIFLIAVVLHAGECLARDTVRAPRKGVLEAGYEVIQPVEKDERFTRGRPYAASTIQVPLFPQVSNGLSLKAGFRGWSDLAGNSPNQTSEARADIDELLVKGNFDYLQIQAGLQRWTWGETFAFQVADVVNPSNLTEFPFSRSQWRKIPVWGADVTVLNEKFTLNGIFVPQSRRPQLDFRLFPEGTEVDSRIDIEHRAECGGKLKMLIADVVDLSLTAYSHESRLPALRMQGITPEIYFPRTLTLGVSLSAAGESTVLRSDFAWRKNEPVFVSDSVSAPVGVAVAAVGLEYASRDGVTLGLQGHADYFPDSTPLLSGKSARFGVSSRISLAESLFFLQPELSAYQGIQNQDFWSGLVLTWNLSRNAVWEFEAHLLNGSKDDGMMLMLADADQLQSRLVFKF
jgi:hypothetical protein